MRDIRRVGRPNSPTRPPMLPLPLLVTLLAQVPAPPSAAAPAPVVAASATPEAGPALPPNVVSVSDHGWIPLFNGKNLDGWYPFRARDGKNNDVEHVFKFEQGVIHVLDVPDITVAQPNGYLATNEEFRNYRIRLEYQWGVKKFAVPRHPLGLPRDGGLLYHMTGPDQVWPLCVEFQIDEHTTGDVFLLPNNPPNPSADSTVAADANGNPVQSGRGVYTFQEGGVPVTDRGQRLIRSQQFDTMAGWNTVEGFISENSGVHVTNGHVNNWVRNLQKPNNGGPMVQGKILLQEENNELFYRKVELKPLFADRYGGPAYQVLVFWDPKTAVAPSGAEVAAVQELGRESNFTVAATSRPDDFTDQVLGKYQVVVFLNTNGAALNATQRQAFERFVHAGGGFVGVNADPDPASGWDWFARLFGTTRVGRLPQIASTGRLNLDDPNHAATNSLPLDWSVAERWPVFSPPLGASVHLVATLQQSPADILGAGGPVPLVWCRDDEGGRTFFTELGSTKEDYANPLFLIHLLGGIAYAAGADGTAPAGATILFDGQDSSHWLGRDGQACPWTVRDGGLAPPPAAPAPAGDIRSREVFADFQAHLEFKVPGTKLTGAPDGPGRNGVYLQGRYEIPVRNSYDQPAGGLDGTGAIFGVRAAAVNASFPAEVWQSCDLTFHAARWQGGKKITPARVTLYLNGVLVQNDTAIPGATAGSPLPEGPESGPLVLQDRRNAVQYRSVWVQPLPATK